LIFFQKFVFTFFFLSSSPLGTGLEPTTAATVMARARLGRTGGVTTVTW
jgi:hypothetical protein